MPKVKLLTLKPSHSRELINDSKQAVTYCGPDASLLNLPANQKKIEKEKKIRNRFWASWLTY